MQRPLRIFDKNTVHALRGCTTIMGELERGELIHRALRKALMKRTTHIHPRAPSQRPNSVEMSKQALQRANRRRDISPPRRRSP